MKFYCIADEDTVRGFQLAGVSGQPVISANEAATALRAAMAQSDCAVVVMTETVADQLRAEVERIRYECDRPLVVEIPGRDGPLPNRKHLWQLAQEAVGIHLETKR